MKTKSCLGLAAFLMAAPGVQAQAPGAVLGPYANRCNVANAPAILVNVVGLKERTGNLRVRTFGGASSTWFEKKAWLTRVELPVPATGPIRICLPVSAAGTYAIDLRHDVNGDGDTDRADGGGASGDPKVTLVDFIIGRKPSPKVTAVRVANGVTEITITVMYLRNGALRPI